MINNKTYRTQLIGLAISCERCTRASIHYNCHTTILLAIVLHIAVFHGVDNGLIEHTKTRSIARAGVRIILDAIDEIAGLRLVHATLGNLRSIINSSRHVYRIAIKLYELIDQLNVVDQLVTPYLLPYLHH